MSEEEKKAIDNFNFFNEGEYITREMAESKDIVLNLIEKQQKENEILKSYLSEQGMISDYLKWRKKNKNV